MSEIDTTPSRSFRWFGFVFGIALLAYLVIRTGPVLLWQQVRSVGVGIAIVILLGGFAHLVKTWAWRSTFTCDISHLSWRRSFSMRLVSEAIGQLGFAGKVLGEGVRVSLLGGRVPVENAVSAAALDSLLYVLTSIVVAISAILASFVVAPLPGKLRVFAVIFCTVFAAILALAAVSFARGWRLMAILFMAIQRLPGCKSWVNRKQPVIDSTERRSTEAS